MNLADFILNEVRLKTKIAKLLAGQDAETALSAVEAALFSILKVGELYKDNYFENLKESYLNVKWPEHFKDKYK